MKKLIFILMVGSLFAGRYFTDQEESIIGAGMADGKVIIDMELLKIGRTF